MIRYVYIVQRWPHPFILQLPYFSFTVRTFAVCCLSKHQVQWTLEQHRFELHGSASIRAVFFNKQPSGSLRFLFTCRFRSKAVFSIRGWERTDVEGRPTVPGSLPFYMRDSASLEFVMTLKGRENLITECPGMSVWIRPSSAATRLKTVLTAFKTET